MTPLQIADASFVFRQLLFMLIDLLVLFVVMAPNPFVALPAVLFLFLDIRPELLHYRRQRCNRAGQCNDRADNRNTKGAERNQHHYYTPFRQVRPPLSGNFTQIFPAAGILVRVPCVVVHFRAPHMAAFRAAIAGSIWAGGQSDKPQRLFRIR